MTLEDKIKKSTKINCIKADFPEINNSELWKEDLKKHASALIEDGIKLMLIDLGFTEKDLESLDQRFKNAKNAIGMEADKFSQICIRGQLLTMTEDEKKKAEEEQEYASLIGSAKSSTGYAMPANLASCELSKIKDVKTADANLYPVMNINVVTSDKQYGLVYLIHEMIHVLASPGYIQKFREKKETRANDEGFTEFFARLAALYCIERSEEYKTKMGYPTLYPDFFKKECKIDGYCLNTINAAQTKALARKYFLTQSPVELRESKDAVKSATEGI